MENQKYNFEINAGWFNDKTLPLETYRAKAQLDLEKTERNCIILNSIKTEVVIETKILVNEPIEIQ